MLLDACTLEVHFVPAPQSSDRSNESSLPLTCRGLAGTCRVGSGDRGCHHALNLHRQLRIWGGQHIFLDTVLSGVFISLLFDRRPKILADQCSHTAVILD